MFMPRILIDARSIADPRSGGVGRAARFWIAFTAPSVIARSVVTTWQSAVVRPGSPPRANRTVDCPVEGTWSPRGLYVRATSDSARNDKEEVVCVTTGLRPSPAVQDFCEQNKYKYLHLRIPNKLWTLFALMRIVSLSRVAEKRVGKIDLVLLPNIGFIGHMHRPYHLLVHDLSFLIEPRWFSIKRRFWHKLLPVKRLIEQATHLDCVSEQTRHDVIKLFNVNSDNTTVIPPMNFGITASYDRRPQWLPNEVKRFALLLGGADPRKNVHTGLQAVSTFNMQHSTFNLTPVVLGGKVKCDDKDCPFKYIQAPDLIDDVELRFLYKYCTMLIYPSWYEGFGLPLHEATQFHAPCIASTAGALPQTAPRGTLFCHPAKVNEWVMAIERIVLG